MILVDSNVIFALSLTILAGLATGAGSVTASFAKTTNTKFLVGSLGFSAGVMIYVSMIEIFQKSRSYLTVAVGDKMGYYLAVAAFFAGIVFIGLIDYFVPSSEGDIGNLSNKDNKSVALRRMGFMTALAIGIHNFPEGLATFTSALKDPQLGVAIAVAIAIHNVPEGIATAVPIYYSSGSRKKAFIISFFSGITEPIGAVIGYLILRPFFNDAVFGILFGAIAGIMIFISIEELLPMAREYEKSKVTIIGVILGMAVIALSLLMFA
ncbi:MAG: zinc transporter ZupT [Oscillospiraceae bacterium]|nr:zinc transporter ZupT [Oscillospiraceae bacterium]